MKNYEVPLFLISISLFLISYFFSLLAHVLYLNRNISSIDYYSYQRELVNIEHWQCWHRSQTCKLKETQVILRNTCAREIRNIEQGTRNEEL